MQVKITDPYFDEALYCISTEHTCIKVLFVYKDFDLELHVVETFWCRESLLFRLYLMYVREVSTLHATFNTYGNITGPGRATINFVSQEAGIVSRGGAKENTVC